MAKQEEKHTIADWFDGLKAEYNKIVWPDGETIGKQSTATLVVSIIVGLMIVVIDMLIQYGVDFLVDLKF